MSTAEDHLLSLTLWPRTGLGAPRRISFAAGQVNYIWSPPRTGKSAFWDLLDFALGGSPPALAHHHVLRAVEWVDACWSSQQPAAQRVLRTVRKLPAPHGGSVSLSFLPDLDSLPTQIESRAHYVSELSKLENPAPASTLGSMTARDFLLLNQMSQHGIGDPFTFANASGRTHARQKLAYCLQAYLGSDAQALRQIESFPDRRRSRLNALRSAEEFLARESLELVRKASEFGLIQDTAATLERQPREVMLKAIEHAARDLTWRRLHERGIPAGVADTPERAIYRLGVLAGRCSQMLVIEREVLKKLRSSDYSSNQQSLDNEREYLAARIPGLEETIGEELASLVGMMELDRLPGKLAIDPSSLSVGVRATKSQFCSLNEIGGRQNYVGYNIAAVLALHLALKRHGVNQLRPLLVIDQPSQAYLGAQLSGPSGLSMEKSVARLQRLYWALDKLADSRPEVPSIVVLERAPPDDLAYMAASRACPEWHGDRSGLLPRIWLEALRR